MQEEKDMATFDEKVETYVRTIKMYSIYIIGSVLIYFGKMYIGGATSDEAVGSALVILVFGAIYTYIDR